MSDLELRDLERAVAADPQDKELADRLTIMWVRAGLGWHGERCPNNVVPTGERGVYVGGPGIQMVYVGDQVPCNLCSLPRWRSGQWVPDGADCPWCSGSGKRVVAPFYIGRFPVTWDEWWTYVYEVGPGGWSTRRPGGRQLRGDFRPVTHVELREAEEFCVWAGLRLPTVEEWRWAALGAPLVDKRFPWGDEAPTPLHAVCQFSIPHQGAITTIPSLLPVQVWSPAEPGGKNHCCDEDRECSAGDAYYEGACSCSCVVRCGPWNAWLHERKRVPARLLGASWCGGLDMVGNIFEYVKNPDPRPMALGGSWRTTVQELNARPIQRIMWAGSNQLSDDVGFRVAL